MPANILVFGTGGVGCVYATILEKGGARVTTVCRSNYDAVKEKGIWMRSAKWGHVRTYPNVVKTCSEAQELYGPFDYIVVASKAFPGTEDLIAKAVTPGKTTIVLAQNGIAIEEAYANQFPSNTIISGVVYLPTTQVSPGVVEHGTLLEQFEIGTYPASASPSFQAQVQRLSDIFAAFGAKAPVHADIQPRRWIKLAVNASFNPMTALTLCDDGNLLRSSPMAISVARDVMREVGRLATAAGYPDIITEDEIEYHMARHAGRIETGGKEPSMLVDVRHERQIEVEAILGNAVRKAEELKVDVPYLRMLYVLAKGRDFAIARNEEWKPIVTIQ
ncbi:Putative ketopantoate reductase ApbA/PanE, 6-phosphogluconate dehydrogenase-like domain superfamily [Septoria linicola]|uniref:2-dehydropantoate 2-reductase n=1 Tax=Septoria linicola TaxID=215465 RepID=A0A9Q9AVT0_9PEZI|nr:putative ketopantoate reductase ApbA/PanE, 6-phosphogluconate dehydrogenase-like domain superfamily [Septoria linicola]USW51596.1 Putative ketopantoate reductase ApbA/PanE, 6-phosphogluconate dehydrogenase-like domain superfamily [Septoria linicola]